MGDPIRGIASLHFRGESNLTVQQKPRHKWWTFCAVSMGTFQSVAIISMVSVSLPTLVEQLGTDITSVQWVILGYSITMAGLLLAFGRLGDVIGRKKIYVSGFIVFGIGSGLCSISNSLATLVASRVLQACGGAMLVSNSTALITSIFPSSERGRALGLNATVVSVAMMVGPTLSGLLIDNLGWRAVFQAHMLISLIGAVLALITLPNIAKHDDLRFDFIGALLLSITLVSLTIAFNQGRQMGWFSPLVLSLLGVWVVSFVLFVIVETRQEQPVLDLRLLRNREFAIGNAGTFIMSVGGTGVRLALPFFVQIVMGYSVTELGLMLMAQSAANSVVAPLSGWLTDRLGPRLLTSLGLALGALALISLGALGPSATYSAVVLRLALLGVGLGLFSTPNNVAIMGSVSPVRFGTASGFMGTMRHLGTTIGLAAIGAVFSDRTAYHASLGESAGETTGLAGAFQDVMWLVAGLYVLGSALCLAQNRGKPVTQAD